MINTLSMIKAKEVRKRNLVAAQKLMATKEQKQCCLSSAA